MRHEKAGRLLELARMLASTSEGLTLDEMAERLGVGRRTAERMRDAVRDVFPQLEDIDDPPTRRFRIPAGLDGLFQAPTAEELAALSAAAETFAQQGAGARAGGGAGRVQARTQPCRALRRGRITEQRDEDVSAGGAGAHVARRLPHRGPAAARSQG